MNLAMTNHGLLGVGNLGGYDQQQSALALSAQQQQQQQSSLTNANTTDSPQSQTTQQQQQHLVNNNNSDNQTVDGVVGISPTGDGASVANGGANAGVLQYTTHNGQTDNINVIAGIQRTHSATSSGSGGRVTPGSGGSDETQGVQNSQQQQQQQQNGGGQVTLAQHAQQHRDSTVHRRSTKNMAKPATQTRQPFQATVNSDAASLHSPQMSDMVMGHPLAHQLQNGLGTGVLPATSTGFGANHHHPLLHYPMRPDLNLNFANLRPGGHTSTASMAAAFSAPTRRYPCKICSAAFDSRAELQVHNQVHMRESKPYKCTHCPKTFANSSYLSQHMRIHLNIKPFGPCQFCSRKFTQLSHLQQHLRTHTGEKPYKCKVAGCEKAFSQLSNLQSHSRCHQSDKPYKCNSCYKCFTEEQALLEHIPKHKESKHLKIHLCPYCGKSYTQQTYLAKHMTKHADRRDREIRLREMNSDTTWPRENAHVCTVHGIPDSCAESSATPHLTFANQFAGAHAHRMMQQVQQQAAQQAAAAQQQQQQTNVAATANYAATAAAADPSSAFTHLAGLAAGFSRPLTGSARAANYFSYGAADSPAFKQSAANQMMSTKHEPSVQPSNLISLTDIQRYAGQTGAVTTSSVNAEQFSAIMMRNAYC